MLHVLLGNAGLIMFLLGIASYDSEKLLIPSAMTVIGLALLVWSAYEAGDLSRWKRK